MKKNQLLIAILFLLFTPSCKKSEDSNNQQSEAFYKSKLESFLKITPLTDTTGKSASAFKFKSYKEMYEKLKVIETGKTITTIDSLKMQPNSEGANTKEISNSKFSSRTLAVTPENGYPNATIATLHLVVTDQCTIGGAGVIGEIFTIADAYSITMSAGYTPNANGITWYGPQVTKNQASTPMMSFSGPGSGSASAIMNPGTGGTGGSFGGLVSGSFTVAGTTISTFTAHFNGSYSVVLPAAPAGIAVVTHTLTCSAATTGDGNPPN